MNVLQKLLGLYSDAGQAMPESIAADAGKSDPLTRLLMGAGQSAWSGLTLPGDVYQGKVPLYADDGRTGPEAIRRSVDLASLLTLGAGAIPAEATSLRAGIRPYQGVPDSLMGFRKSGPQRGFDESNYPHIQDVEVVFGPRDIFLDQIKGMNADHALERAYRNWPDAIHISPK